MRTATRALAVCYVNHTASASYLIQVAGGATARLVCRAHLGDVIAHLLVEYPAATIQAHLINDEEIEQ